MIIKKDSEIVKAQGERKSLALKAKKQSSDEECSTSGSEDEEYAMADDKNDKSDRKCFRCSDPNHLIGECPKPPKDKNQRAFVRGSWSDSDEEDDGKAKDETCLVGQASNESYEANRYTLVIVDDYSRKIKESYNLTFDETPPPSKTSPLVDDDLDEKEAIKVTKKKNLENDIEDETLEINEIVNNKESRNHPLENIIGKLNQRTLRSQAQNQTYVDSETVNQANEDQSSYVPIPLPDDPYVVVRQAQLVNTESELEEAPLEAEELQSLGSIVLLMGEEFEAFEPIRTRTNSSHSSASSNSTTPLSQNHPLTHVSPTPYLPEFHSIIGPYERGILRRMRRMRVWMWMTRDRESQGLDDKGHGLGNEDHSLDDGSQGLKDEGLGLEEEAVPKGQQQAVLVIETATSEPLRLGYKALRRRELAVKDDQVPSTFEVGQSSRSVPDQHGAERVSAFRQPTLATWVDPKDDRVYTEITTYVPLYPPIQTPPSPKWSLGSFLGLLSSLIVPSPIASSVATPTSTISIDED
nr:hypothetical protein [Tanacetum cinerariifolium]